MRHNDFLNDLHLLNKFIKIQSEKNPDFKIEVFLEPQKHNSTGKANPVREGTVNLIVSVPDKGRSKNEHGVSDVLSLNASMTMTGYCLANNEAKANTIFYNNIAMSNLMGAWGFMETAIEQLWWITPKDWDGLKNNTKKLYIERYIQSKDNERNDE